MKFVLTIDTNLHVALYANLYIPEIFVFREPDFSKLILKKVILNEPTFLK